LEHRRGGAASHAEVEHAIARGRAFVESADGARLAIRIAPWLERIGAQRQRAA
jgi:hypothetical protein